MHLIKGPDDDQSRPLEPGAPPMSDDSKEKAVDKGGEDEQKEVDDSKDGSFPYIVFFPVAVSFFLIFFLGQSNKDDAPVNDTVYTVCSDASGSIVSPRKRAAIDGDNETEVKIKATLPSGCVVRLLDVVTAPGDPGVPISYYSTVQKDILPDENGMIVIADGPIGSKSINGDPAKTHVNLTVFVGPQTCADAIDKMESGTAYSGPPTECRKEPLAAIPITATRDGKVTKTES
jgi:hypothetical protein